MIEVVNKYSHKPTENDIYIGRGSILGNIFTHLPVKGTKASIQVKSREEAVSCYKERMLQILFDFDSDNETHIEIKFRENYKRELQKIKNIAMNGDVNLVCFCKPKSCHGDVLKEIVEQFIDENKDFI